uniref:Putative ovule protein n=1 Tax=Solanum chacoense TaxID=4108 RepID=A0A0V0GZP3_SOLCH
MLLEESLAKNEPEVSVELSDSEKSYNMLPKVVKFSDQIEKPKMELPPYQSEQPVDKKPDQVKITSHDEDDLKASKVIDNSNGKLNELESKAKKDDDDLGKDEHKMWEREAEQEEKSEFSENGGTSPTKQQNQKKKKPLFHKFGSLLKKKNTSSQK